MTRLDFNHIDDYDVDQGKATRVHVLPDWSPIKLDNGKWACNHKCKDKTSFVIPTIVKALADCPRSCKHFCCRQGVEKKPKAPKNAFAPASSITDRSLIASYKTMPSSATEKTQSRLSIAANTDGQTEIPDLAGPIGLTNPGTTARREMSNLELLHKKVTKGSLALAELGKKSPFDSLTGEQQNFSHLRKSKGHVASHRPSSEYSDEWANSLPSVADIVGEEKKSQDANQDERPNERSPADTSYRRAISQERVASENDPGTPEPANDHDLSQPDDASDIEEALVGLSDSIHQSTHTGEASDSIVKAKTTSLKTYSDKFCLSTDSPEKPSALPEKRRIEVVSPETSPSLVSEPKRRKVAELDEQAHQSSPDASHLIKKVPMIKAGLPAWVYEFDPAFIAEYQDFVEFI